jgi:large subunit ribosomal protein L28
MARVCSVCGKGKLSGHSVSHSNIKTNRTWEANLQKVRIVVDGAPERAYVCTKCLKAGKVKRAI